MFRVLLPGFFLVLGRWSGQLLPQHPLRKRLRGAHHVRQGLPGLIVGQRIAFA